LRAAHGTSRYSISFSEFSTALTAVLDALVEMPAPIAYQIRGGEGNCVMNAANSNAVRTRRRLPPACAISTAIEIIA
jgi:hypothetical protein